MRVPFDDGWTADDRAAREVPTEVRTEHTRHIITRNESPDIPFEQSVNPYRGCEHGCVYCFARASHPYLGLSAGIEFESRLVAKPEAAERLRRELASPRYRCAVLAVGTNTDAYQPIERELRITRAVLEVLHEHAHPVRIVTKSALVTRDLDLLGPMAASRLAGVGVSVTTLDRSLARRMEPRAATPERRLETIRALSEAGVPVTVMFAPVIPAVNDHELEAVLEAAHDAGARSAGYQLVRLPHEVRLLVAEWLREHFAERASHVLSLLREARGGRLYDARFGHRMAGTGAWADMLALRFRAAVARLGLERGERQLDPSRFRPPAAPGDQLDLFG